MFGYVYLRLVAHYSNKINPLYIYPNYLHHSLDDVVYVMLSIYV